MATPRQEGTLSSLYAVKAAADKILLAAGDDAALAAQARMFQRSAASLQATATSGSGTLWGLWTLGLSWAIGSLASDEAAVLGYNPLDVEDTGGAVETADQSAYFDQGLAGNVSLLGKDVAKTAGDEFHQAANAAALAAGELKWYLYAAAVLLALYFWSRKR